MSTDPARPELALVDLGRDVEAATPDDVDAFLPGLGSDDHSAPGPLENAVMVTLREYASADLLKARDAGKVALALDLCRVMAGKRRANRTSTYANDARLLSEILDSFVAEETAGDAALTEAMQRWAELLAGMSLGVKPAS